MHAPTLTAPAAAPGLPRYQQLAAYYREAIQAGSLLPGDRMPSLRELMRQHEVSLSTALQLSRHLEGEGWLEARPRSGYFVCRPLRNTLAPAAEPRMDAAPDPAQFVGIHARVSEFVAHSRLHPTATNLSIARCAPSLYPAKALAAAAARAMRLQPDLLVTAGPPRGHAGLRAVLAKRALPLGMRLSPDDILITNGCIEALNLALRAVTQPGDTVAVESPTFYGLLQVLEALGLRALEVPTSPHTGISVDALELALRSEHGVQAVVVVPHLQNPLGSIMPDAHKQRLVRLCAEHGVPLVEDDSYSALVNERHADAPPLRALKSWDQDGQVIHCASLHKILAPGLRLGWISAGRWQARVEMLKYILTRNNEDLSQRAAADYMASPAYDRHLRHLRQALQRQRSQTAEAIARYFPPGTRMNLPDGGLGLWVELPAGLSSHAVFHAALREELLVAPGFMFSNSLRYDHCLRINCGWPYTARIEQALQRLGRLLAGLLAQGAASA